MERGTCCRKGIVPKLAVVEGKLFLSKIGSLFPVQSNGVEKAKVFMSLIPGQLWVMGGIF